MFTLNDQQIHQEYLLKKEKYVLFCRNEIDDTIKEGIQQGLRELRITMSMQIQKKFEAFFTGISKIIYNIGKCD